DAAAVLGRPYEIDGRVVRGDQRGRTIGFPTANVRSEQLLPADGVYGGTAHLPGGESFPAAISVGVKPTFEGGHARTMEAHLIGTGGPGQRVAEQEYDWVIRVEIEHWVRAQVRFSGVGELVDAIRRDCQRVVQLVSKGPAHAGSSKA
ncbi:MAG: riboflavin kinase, partial [Phycisphaerales bacterium]|nr:riboflavin kinase [Phycisphaerales bacterium]